MPSPSYPHVNWRAAGTKSDAIELLGRNVLGFYTPGTLASTAFTFEASPTSDGTYVPVKKSDGNALSITVAASGCYGLNEAEQAVMRGVSCLKIVGGSSESAGTQVKLTVMELT